MITSTTTTVSYTGNNSTVTAYSIAFPYLDSADLVVVETDAALTETTLVEDTHYTVSDTIDAEGRITSGSLTTDPAIPVTSTLSITRLTPKTQPTDYVSGGNIAPEVLETSLDRATMIMQEMARDLA